MRNFIQEVNPRRRIFLSHFELRNKVLKTKNRLQLTNWAGPNRSDKVWKNANWVFLATFSLPLSSSLLKLPVYGYSFRLSGKTQLISAKLGMRCKVVGSKRLFYTALSASVVVFCLILSQNTKPYITQTSEDIGYRCMSSDICVFSPYFQSMSHSPKKSEKKVENIRKRQNS